MLLLTLTLSPKVVSPIQVSQIDKAYHFIAFSGFAFSLEMAYRKLGILKTVVFSSMVGILIEVIQYFIPNRGFSFGDMAADFAGVVFGVLVARVLLKNNK